MRFANGFFNPILYNLADMLVIRNEQMETFRKISMRRLAASLAERMRECWPGKCETLGQAELLARCEQCVHDARSLGLRTDQAVARLLNLRFIFGDQFPDPETQPEYAAILGDKTLSEPQRLDHLWGRVMAPSRRDE